MKTTLLAMLLGVFILFFPATDALASLFVSIGENGAMSWGEAMMADNVHAAMDPLEGYAAQQFYMSQIGQVMDGIMVDRIMAARNVMLSPDFDVSDGFGNANGGHTTHQSMVMSWENYMTAGFEDPAVLNVAAWDYHYTDDPDLTGTEIRFSLLPPPGVWDFSLELFDVNGLSRGWFGTPPINAWSNFVIRPDKLNAQGPFLAFFDQPGFDITKVTQIRLNESSQGGRAFFDNPVLAGVSTTPWNAWNSLQVVTPEPATLTLFGLGLGGLLVRRLRRR